MLCTCNANCPETIAELSRENAGLKAANAALQKTLLSGIPSIQDALTRMVKLEAVAKAAEGLMIAKYGFGIPLTSSPHEARKSFDQIMRALEPLQQALSALKDKPEPKCPNCDVRYPSKLHLDNCS